MCNYCEKIYGNMNELNEVAFDTETEFYISDGLVKNNSQIDLVILDHDKHYNKTLENIKFCPYCGRKLNERGK